MSLSDHIAEYKKIVQYKSALVLIIANLLPLFGVIFAHWNAFDLVWLFWFENVIIGFFNILKMLTVGMFGNPPGEDGRPTVAGTKSRRSTMVGMTVMAVFFTLHYGGFSFGHGSFVVAFMAKDSGMHDFSLYDLYVSNVQVAIRNGLGVAMLVLFVSHGFSFVANFLFKREYSAVDFVNLMVGPYARVVILHVAIVFGGFFAMALGSPWVLLLLLIFFKIALDLKLHLMEREHAGAIPLKLAKKRKK
jgi:hypothetical protein